MAGAKGIALTIGINHADQGFYGKIPVLSGCVNDANDVAAIAKSQGFAKVTTLLDGQATVAAVESQIEEAASSLVPGDFFLLHYSGHGMDLHSRDSRGDTNTAWCLFNRSYYDDNLFDFWFKFQPGVRILVLSDRCHSGTAIREVLMRSATRELGARDVEEEPIPRGLSVEEADETIAAHPDVFEALDREAASLQARNSDRTPGAAVILISGCKDEEVSGDLRTNGIFTGSLKKIWNNGAFDGNYEDFHAQIAREVASRSRNTQSPQLFPIGDPMQTGSFAALKPFLI
jgi:hypothetical protein